MPRRFSNQREISATRGAKVAAEPKVPIRTQAAAKVGRPVAREARMYPVPSEAAPIMIGRMMPRRSARRPMITPPMPKPIMLRVKGMEAAPRSAWNSAWTAGRATTTDHMPTPPMADSRTASARRHQA